MKKAAEERNLYLGLFNESEPRVEIAIKKYGKGLQNPISLARRKNHELEEFFSKLGKEYYAETVVGSVLREYLLMILADSIDCLEPVMIYERDTSSFSFRLPFRKNPYLDAFQASLQKITRLTIDENFSQILGRVLTKERFLQQMPTILRELLELGYTDIANKVSLEIVKAFEEKSSGDSGKATQKAIKH